MAPKHKIAVIQLYPEPMQVKRNYDKACDMIRSAAGQGAELAVLPEYHLTNWVPDDPEFRSACAKWKTYLEGYQALAKECNICIVPGTIVELHTDGSHDSTGISADGPDIERLLNVAYFIDPHGQILGKYVKKNLWGPVERLHLTSSSSDAHPVFETPFGKIGLLICWDLAFPEAFREMIAQGAKLFIIPVFWTLNDCSKEGLAHNPAAERLFLDSILTSRCFENTCAIVFVNAGGPTGQGYCGISQIVAPYIGPIVRLGGSAEGMAVAELDMQMVEDAEANYAVRADLAKSDWHYEYRHSRTQADT